MKILNWKLEFEKNLKFEPEVLSLIESKRFYYPFSLFFFKEKKIFFSFHDVLFLGVKKKMKKKRKEKGFFFFFFYWVDWVNLVWLSWFSNSTDFYVGAEFWLPTPFVSLSLLLLPPSSFLPPLTLFTLIFTLIFLLPLTIFSQEKHFSKFLKLPLSISLNISLDPCVLEHFYHTPIFDETHFQNHFSLHQNVFFF